MDPNNNFYIVPLSGDQASLSQEELWRKEQLMKLSETQSKSLVWANAKLRKGWMRNQPCPCGSGIKFKKCCIDTITEK